MRPRHAMPSRQQSLRPGRGLVRSCAKVAGVALLCVAAVAGFSQIGNTVSYFSDSEVSVGNRLQAGIMSLRLSSPDTDTPGIGRLSLASAADALGTAGAAAVDEQDHSGTEFVVSIHPGTASLPFLYTVSGASDAGMPEVCRLIIIAATFGTYHHAGLFTNFAVAATSTMGDWLFRISPPEAGTGTSSPAYCNGRIVFQARLAGDVADGTHGYSDEKQYPFSVFVPGTPLDLKADEATSTPIDLDTKSDPSADGSASSTIPVGEITGSGGSSGGGPSGSSISPDTHDILATSTPDMVNTNPASTTLDISGDPDAASTTPATTDLSGNDAASSTPATGDGDSGDAVENEDAPPEIPPAPETNTGETVAAPPASEQQATPDSEFIPPVSVE